VDVSLSRLEKKIESEAKTNNGKKEVSWVLAGASCKRIHFHKSVILNKK
jgi:hypothetical protein